MIVSGVGTYYYQFDGLRSVAALTNSIVNMVKVKEVRFIAPTF
jgi:hypothetical protein